RVADAERLANINKAKHHIIIYAWPKDNAEATIIEVQGGFKWPHFVLTTTILSQADLLAPEDVIAHFKLYNTSIHTWSNVQVGHIIMLKAGDHIFLKGHDVTHCLDFDHLLTIGQHRIPHFSNNLPHEHAHVQQVLKER
ncbi:hypothetical protein L208DRAFT_1128145, partial [Tricholoma matsutake]